MTNFEFAERSFDRFKKRILDIYSTEINDFLYENGFCPEEDDHLETEGFYQNFHYAFENFLKKLSSEGIQKAFEGLVAEAHECGEHILESANEAEIG